jgi:signal peptidase I
VSRRYGSAREKEDVHAMKAGMMLRRRWLLVLAAIALVALALLFLAPRLGWDISSYDLLRVRSGSMQPTLRTGETILADMSHYRRHQPRRGELAIYLTPGSTNELSIKRILALAGDRVLVRRGRAVVNGRAVDEPYAEFGDPGWSYNNTGTFIVPAGSVFVLGDNRANSKDSRVRGHGFVPVDRLVGRALRIVWTADLPRLGRSIGTP